MILTLLEFVNRFIGNDLERAKKSILDYKITIRKNKNLRNTVKTNAKKNC